MFVYFQKHKKNNHHSQDEPAEGDDDDDEMVFVRGASPSHRSAHYNSPGKSPNYDYDRRMHSPREHEGWFNLT